MKEEILAVKIKDMGLSKAARIFDVSKSSLRRRLQKLEKSNTGDNTDIIHKKLLCRLRNVLSESQEEELKKYITDMDNAFYRLTFMDIRVLVFEYFKRNEIDNPFSKETEIAGEDIVRGFLERHKDLALLKTKGVALNRVFGLNKEVVERYFDNFVILLNENHFEPHQIYYNCDETGITTVHKPAKVIAPTGKNCVSSMISGEKGITTTVLCACNATGHFVPPIMIFKTKNTKTSLIDYAPPETMQECSENGWVNTEFI